MFCADGKHLVSERTDFGPSATFPQARSQPGGTTGSELETRTGTAGTESRLRRHRAGSMRDLLTETYKNSAHPSAQASGRGPSTPGLDPPGHSSSSCFPASGLTPIERPSQSPPLSVLARLLEDVRGRSNQFAESFYL